MITLPKAIYILNVIPVKIPSMFFAEMEKLIPKFTQNCKGPQRANLEKEK